MDLELHAGDLSATLDAATGGAIAALMWRGIKLLQPVSDPRLAAQHGRAVAAYPLIPYANRIAQARFTLDGTTHQLARNFVGEPHSLHGNAWMRPWSVAEASTTRARLTLSHRPPADPATEWPFAYDAEQLFTLAHDCLTVALSIRNTDTRRFPAGLGLHPYVARTPKTLLAFDADTIWQPGPDSLPTTPQAVPLDLCFTPAKAIGGRVLDACFAGWGGQATVAMLEHGIALHIESGPPLDHFQVYTPKGADYCGLEPVSNLPDAINRMQTVSDQGMKMLAPGEDLHASITLRVVQTSR
jgi:aldose 1-epimerase